ncbi:MAG: hypothetical protein HYX68_21050 [Planctomycetes bacterium]|nr:hypothetical protein [Planctomycetota bacterium]
MTRKLVWSLLLCLTQLATLPGCLHLPYFSSTTSESPKKTDGDTGANFIEREPKHPVDIAPPIPPDEHFAGLAQVSGTTPKALGPILLPPPRTAIDLLREQASASKKPGADQTAVVTVEGAPPLKGARGQKTPLPTLEKKAEYPFLLALHCMIEKRHDEALQHLRAYDRETQEFFLRLMPVLLHVMQKPISELSLVEIALVNQQLRDAEIISRARCELAVNTLRFCKQVRGYGAYEPLPDNHTFVSGTKSRLGDEVHVYAELKNLRSEKTKDGVYLTRLASRLELKNAAGKKIWSRSFDRVDQPQVRRAPVNDFHKDFRFFVPAIPPGTYQLTVQVVDETNAGQRRVASKSLDFRVTPAAN